MKVFKSGSGVKTSFPQKGYQTHNVHILTKSSFYEKLACNGTPKNNFEML